MSKTVKLTYIFTYLLVLSTKLLAQSHFSVYVFDIKNNTAVSNAAIVMESTGKGTYTDNNGYFELDNSSKNEIIVISKIGYETKRLHSSKIENTIYLTPKSNNLNETIIHGFSSSQLKKITPDQIYFSKKDIEKLPFILGEKDIIKLIQLTPGIQPASEGQSGLLVRGGNASMNLTLLDNVYLHNTAHLGGLFTAINSDFVHSLSFSKAGFDGQFGGRLSSITEINTLEKPKTTSFNGSIGLLAAKITGNIKINEKNSLLVSGRRSYLEVLKPLINDNESILGDTKNYFLYDFLTKYRYEFNAKSSFEAFTYITRDNFSDKTKVKSRKLVWGNLLIGANFHHNYSENLNSKTTVSNSYYEFEFSDNNFPFNYDAKNTFNNFSIKHTLSLKWNNKLLKFGGNFDINSTLPKRINASIDYTPIVVQNQVRFHFKETAIFGDLELPISNKTSLKTGLRIINYRLDNNVFVEKNNRIEYEPRLSLKYDLTSQNAFKLSYQRISQFMHQASIPGLSLPIDFFITSTKVIKPQISDQLSFGYTHEHNGFQLNSSIYYKKISNYTEFINGAANNLFNSDIFNDIAVGSLNSYGLEVSVKKKIKRFTSQTAFTLSRSIANFKVINEGKDFPATFDRPININTILRYQLNKRIEIGALFIYTSGQTYTRPKDVRIINEEPLLNFEQKNRSRYPSYHRLDLSCTYSFKPKKKWNSKLNLTLYNVYNQKNTFNIYHKIDGDLSQSYSFSEVREALFPFIPTLNWLFKF